MSVLRDIFRRRLRSVLTISGVAVGVFALTMLGAVAEKSTVQIDVVGDVFEGHISVVEENDVGYFGFGNGKRPLSSEQLSEIETVAGVSDVSPQVALLIDETAMITGVPPMILGGDFNDDPGELTPAVEEGRPLAPGERDAAVLGVDLASQLDVRVGEPVRLRGREFEVTGILGRTLVQVYDQAAFVSLADARELYVEWLPPAFQSKIDADTFAMQAAVSIADGADPDEVARRINEEVEGAYATGPSEMKRQVVQLVAVLNIIVASVGGIALLVGGLSVINTMLVAVAERTHEIGVKRALGASTGRVARDVLVESATIGGLGGIFGLLGGALVATAFESWSVASRGIGLFLITGRLVVGVVVFAVLLGVIGGLYPATYAARMDPVDALAHE